MKSSIESMAIEAEYKDFDSCDVDEGVDIYV